MMFGDLTIQKRTLIFLCSARHLTATMKIKHKKWTSPKIGSNRCPRCAVRSGLVFFVLVFVFVIRVWRFSSWNRCILILPLTGPFPNLVLLSESVAQDSLPLPHSNTVGLHLLSSHCQRGRGRKWPPPKRCSLLGFPEKKMFGLVNSDSIVILFKDLKKPTNVTTRFSFTWGF